MAGTLWHLTRDGRPAEPGPEGFVHASFTGQLAGTLGHHFADATSVTLLRLDEDALGRRLLVEPSRGGEPFPHVYGELREDDVRERLHLRRGADGAFDVSAAERADREAARTDGVTAVPHDPTSAPFVRLRPAAVSRPWGGRRVATRLRWPDGGGRAIGEWWLASSHPSALTGLRDLPGHLGTFLDGPGRTRGCPSRADFPLLVKLLDADEVLSLQVHPDDVVARRHGMPRGKTEAWHVLAAEPDAAVWLGTADGVRASELLGRIAAGAAGDDLLPLLRRVPLRAGDTVLVPAGTVHAIGPGLLLYEIQQASDATYRLHDWGRGREVHLSAARDAAKDLPPPAVVRREPRAGERVVLLDEPAFVLSRARGGVALSLRGRYGVLTVIDGRGELSADGHRVAVEAGDTLLLLSPVQLSGGTLDVLLAEPGAD